MKKTLLIFTALSAMFSVFGTETAPAQKVPAKKVVEEKYPEGYIPKADEPFSGYAVREKGRGWWKNRFDGIKKTAQKKGKSIQLVFFGDSITHFLSGKKCWKEFSYCNPLNVGFSGDRTQHTLWVVEESGLLDLIEPKLIVVMIGINNNGGRNHFKPEETARGITRIVKSLHEKEPQAKIVLFGIFPRGAKPNRYRRENDEVNAIICKLGDGKNVFYENINDKFLNTDGTLKKEYYNLPKDSLHPNNAGCQVWFDAVRPYVYKYIGKPAPAKK